MNKTIGYVIMAVGLIAFGLSYSKARALVGINLPSGITDTILLITGLVVLAVGVFYVVRSTQPQQKEVPIYEGKKVVGYRRV